MSNPAESMMLDDDVLEELRKLAARSGRPIDVLVNAALRDYLHCENEVVSSLERGLSDLDAGRVSTTDEILEILRRAREGLASDGGSTREDSIARARSAIESVRSRKE